MDIATGSNPPTRRGFALHGNAPLNTIRESAADAEVRGYDSFWLNQPPGENGLIPLAEAADVTLRVALGTGVIPLSHTTPDEIAFNVRDLHLPLDRLLLGIGSGSSQGGLQRVSEGVETLRGQLGVRIVVAALGPRMCRLAGEIADGVLLNWLVPEFARTSVGWIREGAERAGRGMPTVYGYVRVAFGDASIDRFRQEAGRYAAIPQYAAHFKRQGVEAADTGVLGTTHEEIQRGLAAWDGVVDEVVVRAIPAHDTVGEALQILEAAML
jgi:alkanesulfonate monooxygenase SsuD/methylene tetrahydromethanopterin reductase-like flavin-dependent oxidoreductase (luciferase family)